MNGEANGKHSHIEAELAKKPSPERVEHDYRHKLVDRLLQEKVTGYDAAIIRGLTTIMQVEGVVKDDLFEQLLSKLSNETGKDRAMRYTERIVNTFLDNPMFIVDLYHMCFHFIARYEKDLPLDLARDMNIDVCTQMKMEASPQAQEEVVIHATRSFVSEWISGLERSMDSVRKHYDEVISPAFVVTVHTHVEKE